MNISVQADKLNSYRFCDNVWTFILKEVEFRENSDLAKVSFLASGPTADCSVPVAGGQSQDRCL